MQTNFFTDLTHLSLISVQGAKAQAFLQGQLTCDVREVTPTQTRLGAHCNLRGRVLSSFRAIQLQGTYYLQLPTSMAELAIKELQKYALLSRVKLELVTNSGAIGCYGTQIAAYLTNLFTQLPEQTGAALTINSLLITGIADQLPRFEIFADKATLQTLCTQLKQFSQVSNAYWRLLDIQAGLATIYPKTMELFTPHMLNYPNLAAVSFKKGCYIGQEVIARTQYLGKTKRQLYLGRTQQTLAPQPGDLIYCEELEAKQEVGTIVDAVSLDSPHCDVLAVIHEEAKDKSLVLADGTAVVVR